MLRLNPARRCEMVRNEERIKVLKMVQEGKITVDEATELLQSLEDSPGGAKPASQPADAPAGNPAPGAKRWFRVRVSEMESGRVRINVRLPVGVINAGLKMGMKFAPQVEGMDPAVLVEMINSGEVGQIVDVYDEKDGEHVEVFIE
jgi:hypothetical protein